MAAGKGSTMGANEVRVKRDLSERRAIACASWPDGGTSRGLCLGVCVEGHEGLSLSP
jgi:hypothetical protein